MNKKEKAFEDICDLLEDRLNVLGPINSQQAYQLCKDHYAYSTIITTFKTIMDLMIAQGKAIRVGRGSWNITKPNKKKHEPETVVEQSGN
jgi:hypothetical protein